MDYPVHYYRSGSEHTPGDLNGDDSLKLDGRRALSDAVPTQRGKGKERSGRPEPPRPTMVHSTSRYSTRHRIRTGHHTEEILHRQERVRRGRSG